MRFKSILGIALIPMVAYAANPVVGEAPAAMAVAPSIDDFTALDEEFDTALVEYTKELKAADKAQRRELRANSPIKLYWPRFEAKWRARGVDGDVVREIRDVTLDRAPSVDARTSRTLGVEHEW